MPLATISREPRRRSGRTVAAWAATAAIVALAVIGIGSRKGAAPSVHRIPPSVLGEVASFAPSLPQSANPGTPADPDWTESEREHIRQWAEQNPRGAGERVLSLRPGASRRFMLDVATIAWGNVDPAAAAQWADGLADEREKSLALANISGEAVRTDPQLALSLACRLPPGAERDAVLARAATEWAVHDPEAAVAWARRLPDTPLRTIALGDIATAWSDRDAISAIELAATAMPAGRLQDNALVAIIQRWSQKKPAAAAAWVENLPPDPLRIDAIENVAALWSVQDATAAQAWIDGLATITR